MDYPLNDFIKHSQAIGHSEEFLEDTKKYAQQLSDSKLPVIFSLPHLAIGSGFNIDKLKVIVNSSRRTFYKRFKLSKRSGGFRTILSPESPLKYLQRWILNNILNKIPSHPNCMGFDPQTSICKNAGKHLNSEAILKIDLLRFFDSINEKRIYGIFQSIGYHKNLSVSLAKLCSMEPDNTFFIAFKDHELILRDSIKRAKCGILPQGAPSSPKLANLVARKLDFRLTALASKHQLSYSRYADDLNFSGDRNTLIWIEKIVYKIIESEGFFVNFGKTQHLVRGNKFFVTGLSVHNEVVKIPKKRKKEIEHHLFHCKNGVHVHILKANILQRNFKDWLLGSICFVYSVEKELGKKYFEDFAKIEWPI